MMHLLAQLACSVSLVLVSTSCVAALQTSDQNIRLVQHTSNGVLETIVETRDISRTGIVPITVRYSGSGAVCVTGNSYRANQTATVLTWQNTALPFAGMPFHLTRADRLVALTDGQSVQVDLDLAFFLPTQDNEPYTVLYSNGLDSCDGVGDGDVVGDEALSNVWPHVSFTVRRAW